jgi:hypothetical protein
VFPLRRNIARWFCKLGIEDSPRPWCSAAQGTNDFAPLDGARDARLGDPEPNLTDLLFAFCVPMRLPQAHPGPTTIPIDEFNAGSLQSTANGQVVGYG